MPTAVSPHTNIEKLHLLIYSLSEFLLLRHKAQRSFCRPGRFKDWSGQGASAVVSVTRDLSHCVSRQRWVKAGLPGLLERRCATPKKLQGKANYSLAPARGWMSHPAVPSAFRSGITRERAGSGLQHGPPTSPRLPVGSRKTRSKSPRVFPFTLPCKAHPPLSVAPGFPPELRLSRFLIPSNICISAVFFPRCIMFHFSE